MCLLQVFLRYKYFNYAFSGICLFLDFIKRNVMLKAGVGVRSLGCEKGIIFTVTEYTASTALHSAKTTNRFCRLQPRGSQPVVRVPPVMHVSFSSGTRDIFQKRKKNCFLGILTKTFCFTTEISYSEIGSLEICV